MIPRGHEHRFRPFSTRDRADGLREVNSRCVCHQDASGTPTAVVEQRLVYDPATGEPRQLAVRFGGLWFDPVDLVRLAGAGLEECPACHGETPEVAGTTCATCGGVRVVSGGDRLRPPDVTRA